MLTDILIADESEANAIAETVYPLGIWNGIDAKGQSAITLGTLLSLLTQEPYRNEIVDEFALLIEDPSGDLFVCKIPDQLVLALSQLRAEDFPTLAKEWSQTDEMIAAGLDRTKELVEELSRLSIMAIQQQKNLLLRICL